MRLFIPSLGTELTLSEDWGFELHSEYRNYDFWEVATGKKWSRDSAFVVLPAGSKLKVDRIFIRRGAEDYDSITFWLIDCPNKAWAPKKVGGTAQGRLRFWVKLNEANNIIFDET